MPPSYINILNITQVVRWSTLHHLAEYQRWFVAKFIALHVSGKVDATHDEELAAVEAMLLDVEPKTALSHIRKLRTQALMQLEIEMREKEAESAAEAKAADGASWFFSASDESTAALARELDAIHARSRAERVALSTQPRNAVQRDWWDTSVNGNKSMAIKLGADADARASGAAHRTLSITVELYRDE